MNDPTIGVVVPTFRRPQELQRCLDALAKQTVRPMVVEVVDDAKTDRGPAWARNQGWRRCQTDIIAFTDDDCVPDADWIQSIARAFADPAVVAVEGSIYRMEGGRRQSMDPPAHIRWCRFRTANLAVRRSVLEEIGGFDEGYHIHREDTDLAWRIIHAGYAIPFAADVRVLHPDRPGMPRFLPDSERRLCRLDRGRYAECLATQLHRKARRDGTLRRLRRSLHAGGTTPAIPTARRITLWIRAALIAASWHAPWRGR